MPIFTTDFVRQITSEIDSMGNAMRIQPLLLLGVGGADGGGGGPIGGIIGQLPQKKVTFDTTESSSNTILGSGNSILINLNRIRGGKAMGVGFLQQHHIASGIGTLTLQDDTHVLERVTKIKLSGATFTQDSPPPSGVVTINFTPSLTVQEIDGVPLVSNVNKIIVTNGTLTDNLDGSVNINTGGNLTVVSGHIIQDEGISLTPRKNLNFVGTGVTLTDDPVNDTTIATISIPTIPSGIRDYKWYADGPLAPASGIFGVYKLTGQFTPTNVTLHIKDSGPTITSADVQKSADGSNWLSIFSGALPQLSSGVVLSNFPILGVTIPSGYLLRSNTVLTSDYAKDITISLEGQVSSDGSGGNGGGSVGTPGFQTLSDGANISWDLSLGSGEITLGGNRTLDNPTNMASGEHYFLNVIQDGTGNRTLDYGNAYKFSNNIHPVLSTFMGYSDILPFECNGNYMYSTGIYHNLTNVAPSLSYLTSLTMWLKADAGVYSDNGVTLCGDTDTVYLWQDSNASNDAIQTDAGRRPQYRTSVLSGLPVIRFNGVDNDLVLSALDAGDNCSFFIVIVPSDTTPIGLFDSSGNFSVPPIRNDGVGNWDWYFHQPATDMALANTDPVLLEFIHSQSSGRSISYYKNGIFVSTNTDGSTDATIWDIPRIGSINVGDSFYTGDIAEFLIYSETISSGNRATVETYLKSKYGIS